MYIYITFWRRKWQPTPVLLPGESHSQRRLAGYRLWDYKSRIQLSATYVIFKFFSIIGYYKILNTVPCSK